MPSELDPVYLFGPFRVSVASLELFRDGQPLSLPPKTFDTLVLLLTHHQRVVTKEELLKSVWREAFVSDDSLSQCISGLRKALGDDPNQPQFIATIPRRGYRFIGPVRVEGAVAPAERPQRPLSPARWPFRPLPARRAHPAVLRRLSPWPFVITALASLGVGVALTLWLADQPARPLRLNLQPPIGTSSRQERCCRPTYARRLRCRGGSQRKTTAVGGRARGRANHGSFPTPTGPTSPSGHQTHAHSDFRQPSVEDRPRSSGADRPSPRLRLDWPVPRGVTAAPLPSRVSGRPSTPLRPRVDASPASAPLTPHKETWPNEWPHLPGGTQFLFTIDSANPDRAGTYVASVTGGEPRRLVPDPHGIDAAPGHPCSSGTARSWPSASYPVRLTLSGTPSTVVGSVSAPSLRNDATISASTGLLTFGGASGGGAFSVDRSERTADRRGQRAGEFHNPALMPDGQRVLVDGTARGPPISTGGRRRDWFRMAACRFPRPMAPGSCSTPFARAASQTCTCVPSTAPTTNSCSIRPRTSCPTTGRVTASSSFMCRAIRNGAGTSGSCRCRRPEPRAICARARQRDSGPGVSRWKVDRLCLG